MTNARTPLHAALAAILLGLLPATASASGLQVDPLSLTLTSFGDIAVTNSGADTMRVSVTANDWTQTIDEPRHVAETQELAYFPKVFTIAPGQTQRVRVGVTLPAAATERAYRLYITELPPLDPGLANGGPHLQVLTRMDLPVFQQGPASAAPAPRIDRAIVTSKGLRIVLENEGDRHVVPSKVAVSGLDAAGASVWSGNADEWYVLAKSERSADLDLAAATCAKIKNFAVTWSIGTNAITKTLPNGGCR